MKHDRRDKLRASWSKALERSKKWEEAT